MVAYRQDDNPLGQVPKVNWLPDETFFSLCSRQHVLSCNVLSETTSIQLLGLTKKRIKHDLPCGLDAFEHNSSGFWGSANSIILDRTILPFFAPFSSEVEVNAAISTFKTARIGSLKYRLGLITGGFGAEHPLKGCPECLKCDLSQYGVAYWRLAHQYPGMVLCPSHQVWLRESNMNRHWADRFAWSLPREGSFLPPPHVILSEQPVLRSLTQAIADLAALGLTYSFDPNKVSEVYRHELPQTSSATSLLRHIEPLRGLLPFKSLPTTEEAASCFIKCLTRKPRGHFHPLKHLVMITWLFEDLQSFIERYEQVEGDASSTPRPEQSIVSPDPVVPAHCARKSMAAPRPKRLKPPVRSALLARLVTGESKASLCSEFDITVSTVNKLLRAEPAVQTLWVNVQRDRERFEHRASWLSLRSSFPEESVKSLRARAAATYAWLYRTDRPWLLCQASQTPKPHRANRTSIDWAERDSRLQALVRESLMRVYGTDRGLSLSRSQLFALIPVLHSCLESRARYPATRSYLRTIEQLSFHRWNPDSSATQPT